MKDKEGKKDLYGVICFAPFETLTFWHQDKAQALRSYNIQKDHYHETRLVKDITDELSE